MATDLQNSPETSSIAEGKPLRDEQGRLLPGQQSLNPGGRPKKKPITDALLDALARNPGALKQIADALVERAMIDTQTFNSLRDTIQGKPALTIQGDADNPLEVNLNDAKSKLLTLLGE